MDRLGFKCSPRVSILAQPGGRALRVRPWLRSTASAVFQSSPSPGAGRCINQARNELSALVSILAQPGGRALRKFRIANVAAWCRVSILAQPGGRALLGCAGWHFLDRGWVSILAQPGGRALPD